MCKKSYIWNLGICSCENGRYTENTIDDSVITCAEIIETTKSNLTKTVPLKRIPTNFYEKKVICQMKSYYILLLFLLITTHE